LFALGAANRGALRANLNVIWFMVVGYEFCQEIDPFRKIEVIPK
jgi:hypothetical protein